MDVGNATAFANYRRTAGAVIITHTETRGPCAARHRLATGRGALQLIQAKGEKVVAGCSFVAKHPSGSRWSV